MEAQDHYSLIRFWRYIFTPLLLILIAFVWYIVFNISGTQLGVGSMSLYKDPLSAIPSAANAAIVK